MAVGLYIKSQDELTACLPAASQVARAFGDLLIVFVDGKEDALLAKAVRAKLKSREEGVLEPNRPKVRLKALGDDAVESALLKEVQPLDKLLLPHSTERRKEQASLADKAACTTIRLLAGESNIECDRVFVTQFDYKHGSARRMAQRVSDQLGAELTLPPIITPPKYQSSDLVLIGTPHDGSRDAEDIQLAEGLRTDADEPPAVGVVLTGHSQSRRTYAAFENFVQHWVPQMQRDARKKLTEALQVFVAKDGDTAGQQLRDERFDFIAMISASTALASLGLVQDSAAVIIGAMLVAPLMSPILAGSLAVVHSHPKLFKEAWKMIFRGFAFALAISFVIGLLYPGLSTVFVTREIASRCRPSLMDFLIGVAGGGAAAYARTRDQLSSALAGAAIAAALVPPIASAGLNAAFVLHNIPYAAGVTELVHPIVAPLLLFGMNVLSIMLAGSISLWASGLRSYNNNSEPGLWQKKVIAFLVALAAASVTATYIIDVDAAAKETQKTQRQQQESESDSDQRSE